MWATTHQQADCVSAISPGKTGKAWQSSHDSGRGAGETLEMIILRISGGQQPEASRTFQVRVNMMGDLAKASCVSSCLVAAVGCKTWQDTSMEAASLLFVLLADRRAFWELGECLSAAPPGEPCPQRRRRSGPRRTKVSHIPDWLTQVAIAATSHPLELTTILFQTSIGTGMALSRCQQSGHSSFVQLCAVSC